MIVEERKVAWSDQEQNADLLKEQGYVSAKSLHRNPEVRSLFLPEAKVLRSVAKTPGLGLRSIRCNVAGTSSWWYNLEDLKTLYSKR